MVRLNATLGTHIGVLESSFAVHVAGTIFSTVLILPGIARLGRRIAEPSLALFSGGALGVFIVLVANVLVPVLGIALTLSLSVVANLAFSTVADHFGWLGLPVIRVTWQRVAGLLLAVVGVVLVAFG
jgi:transporter family-2 protein